MPEDNKTLEISQQIKDTFDYWFEHPEKIGEVSIRMMVEKTQFFRNPLNRIYARSCLRQLCRIKGIKL